MYSPELQVVVSHGAQVLGTELRPSIRAEHVLHAEPSLWSSSLTF